MRMRKEHSAADWSTRPLPKPWLDYAALDVEVLVELRDLLAAELEETGKAEWARQEFDHLLGFEPAVRHEAWRRMSGVHRLRGRRALAAARHCGRRATTSRPNATSPRGGSSRTPRSSPRPPRCPPIAGPDEHPGLPRPGRERYATHLGRCDPGGPARLAEDDLPSRAPRGDGPPHPRIWADRDIVADRRFKAARESMLNLAEDSTTCRSRTS